MRGGGFILLFAFTYLWVAANNFLNAGGRAFGWYCLFVAVTAVPAGILTLDGGGGDAVDLPRPQLVRLGGPVVPVLPAARARPSGGQAGRRRRDRRGDRDRLGVRFSPALGQDSVLDHRGAAARNGPPFGPLPLSAWRTSDSLSARSTWFRSRIPSRASCRCRRRRQSRSRCPHERRRCVAGAPGRSSSARTASRCCRGRTPRRGRRDARSRRAATATAAARRSITPAACTPSVSATTRSPTRSRVGRGCSANARSGSRSASCPGGGG